MLQGMRVRSRQCTVIMLPIVLCWLASCSPERETRNSSGRIELIEQEIADLESAASVLTDEVEAGVFSDDLLEVVNDFRLLAGDLATGLERLARKCARDELDCGSIGLALPEIAIASDDPSVIAEVTAEYVLAVLRVAESSAQECDLVAACRCDGDQTCVDQFRGVEAAPPTTAPRPAPLPSESGSAVLPTPEQPREATPSPSIVATYEECRATGLSSSVSGQQYYCTTWGVFDDGSRESIGGYWVNG